LVLPLGLALSFADQKGRGLLHLPSLNTAISVLTSLCDAPLEDHHRDLLWHAFGVPVFEQLRGWDGAIIARECEVHDGLHIDNTAVTVHLYEDELLVTQLRGVTKRARTGLTAKIVTDRCECGAKTPRLREVATISSRISASIHLD
jgi:hypothetical protein